MGVIPQYRTNSKQHIPKPSPLPKRSQPSCLPEKRQNLPLSQRGIEGDSPSNPTQIQEASIDNRPAQL